MKRYKLLFLLSFTILASNAQRFTDIGIIGGTSVYFGELNQSNYLYNPTPFMGGFFRVNINKRVAVRVNGNYINLSGNYADYDDGLLFNRTAPTFPNRVIDFNSQVEYNWLPYITGEDKLMNSIYVSGGLGYSLISNSPNSLTLPFGLGFKINLSDRLSSGFEWSFRKTFTDAIDGIQDPIGSTVLNNNDWYSDADGSALYLVDAEFFDIASVRLNGNQRALTMQVNRRLLRKRR